MNPTIHSGTHPDAESLTAFAEQLLPEAERQQVLAHMATCSRCREVVFLAQKAEEPTTTRVSTTAPKKQRASWFSGWRWMWVPAAAIAGIIGVAVMQHFRHTEPEPQMTAKLSQTDALGKETEPAKSAPANNQSPTRPKAELQKAKPAEPLEARDRSLRRADKDEAKQLDQKKSVQQKEPAVGSTAPIAPSPELPSLSTQGNMAARAKVSPYGGPLAANQFQQNLDQQNLARQNLPKQNALQESRTFTPAAANKPAAASSAPASATETVSVQAERMELAPRPVPAEPPQISPIPLNGRNFATLSASNARQSNLQKIKLPNGLGVLSVASEASRSVALDTAGGVFLSEDGGKHWRSIQAQWTGRAVLVRTRPAPTQNGVLQAPQTMRFELVNDKLQTWVSYDGKTWTAQPIPIN